MKENTSTVFPFHVQRKENRLLHVGMCVCACVGRKRTNTAHTCVLERRQVENETVSNRFGSSEEEFLEFLSKNAHTKRAREGERVSEPEREKEITGTVPARTRMMGTQTCGVQFAVFHLIFWRLVVSCRVRLCVSLALETSLTGSSRGNG